MLCICYSACTEENTSLEGTILHIQESKAWQITMFRDLTFMTGGSLEDRQPSALCVALCAETPLRILEGGGAFCGHYTPTWTHRSLFQMEFRSFPWVCPWYSLWIIYEAITLNITYDICIVTGTIPFSKVKRLWTELISYQWIFRNGSEWKPFVIGNPFLIEFMHLLSLWGLTIILLLSQKPKVRPVWSGYCADLPTFAPYRVPIIRWICWKIEFIEWLLTFTNL